MTLSTILIKALIKIKALKLHYLDHKMSVHMFSIEYFVGASALFRILSTSSMVCFFNKKVLYY